MLCTGPGGGGGPTPVQITLTQEEVSAAAALLPDLGPDTARLPRCDLLDTEAVVWLHTPDWPGWLGRRGDVVLHCRWRR